jgi:hypothetical protein
VLNVSGWSFEQFRDADAYVNNARKLGILRAFYDRTKCFVIDEVNALSAATLGQLDETLNAIFNPPKHPNRSADYKPFGGVKIIFLGYCSHLCIIRSYSACNAFFT